MYGVRSWVGSAARGGQVQMGAVRTCWSPKKGLATSSDDASGSGQNDGRSVDRSVDSHDSSVDYYDGRQHEFSASRSRDILDYGYEHSAGTGSNEVHSNGTGSYAAQGVAEMSCRGEQQSDSDRADILSHNGSTAVSLNSCMQSNVPEPFNPQGRNPTHVNMPGGGILRSQKYVYGDIHRTHPSRQFSTSSARYAMAQPATNDFDVPCPQGVQGDDCVRFKIWYENCRRLNLPNCDEQIESIKSGRKTLAQVFTEQDSMIREVVENFEKRFEGDSVQAAQDDINTNTMTEIEAMQGLQDVPMRLRDASIEQIVRSQLPSPQGIQGEDCERFGVWLKNCSRFGTGHCQEQLSHLRSGRKTLSQIFQEQDRLLENAAQRRHYSTGPGSSGPGSNPGGASNPGPAGTPSESSEQEVSGAKLTQRQKLQRAVKQYGATVVVFHVGISLMSLGGFYVAVSSGIDMVGILANLGLGESIRESRLATGASTFVVAYAVHKVFAPVRIAITLTSTPFIVRYLRSVGVLKAPKL